MFQEKLILDLQIIDVRTWIINVSVADTSRIMGGGGGGRGRNFQHVCLRCPFKICESFKYYAWYIKFIV